MFRHMRWAAIQLNRIFDTMRRSSLRSKFHGISIKTLHLIKMNYLSVYTVHFPHSSVRPFIYCHLSHSYHMTTFCTCSYSVTRGFSKPHCSALNLDYIPGFGQSFFSCGRWSWSHKNIAHHGALPWRRRHAVRTL